MAGKTKAEFQTDTYQTATIEGVYPLVVTIQGHTVLVALVQQALEKVMADFTLQQVTIADGWGGSDGVAFLEWAFGFKVVEEDLLGAYGARYREFKYQFPHIDLVGEGMRLVRSQAINAAKKKRQKEAALLQEGLRLDFGSAPGRKRGRPKKNKEEPSE